MSVSASNNQRIAKNTIFLYIRTIIVLMASLYTSRLVFKALGETDLGIYNLVGGIVALMAFLHSAQTKSTSRFITYKLGLGSGKEELSRTFSICMTIHILIILAIFVLAETIGLLIINKWTTIPDDRMFSANIVYQFSILTFVAHFIRVPFDSVVIAHEDMSIYAYMSVFEVALQLGAVLFLSNFIGDRLILYAALLFLISLILFSVYAVIVRKKHGSYHYHWLWDKEESLTILSFSGWTMLGSTTNTATQQGVSLFLNNFVGLIANTALGFANQVHAALGKFTSSFSTAFNPQIIKLYAQGENKALHILIGRASKFSFVLCYILALPLICNMDLVLRVWLGSVPQYTTEFCQLILVCSIIDATSGPFNTAITATGRIRNYQIWISASFLLDLLVSFLLLKIGLLPQIVFGSRIFTRGILNFVIGLYFSRNLMEFSISQYVRIVALPVLFTVVLSVMAVYFIASFSSNWIRLILTVLVGESIVCLCTFFVIMNSGERKKVFTFLKTKLKDRLWN